MNYKYCDLPYGSLNDIQLYDTLEVNIFELDVEYFFKRLYRHSEKLGASNILTQVVEEKSVHEFSQIFTFIKMTKQIEAGKKYYAMGVLCMPIEVLVMQVDYVKQKAEIKQGWIPFSDLYENEADFPCR